MRSFKNILVYAEAADGANLAEVVELAESQNASLSVCNVISSPPALPGTEDLTKALKALDWQLSFESLRALCAPYMSRVPIEYTIFTGIPFLVITEQVTQRNFDLVVHISEATGEGGAGLNPTGMHLVRKCPCAVWTMRPGQTANLRSVLLAIDHSNSGDTAKTAQNTLLLANTAASFAKNLGTELHVLHAWQPYGEHLFEHETMREELSAKEQFLAAQHDYHAQWLDELMGRIRGAVPNLRTQSHLLKGPVTRVLPALADAVDSGLIVMGTVGTSAQPGVLIGTSAEAILTSSNRPILTIKPQGFQTPLRFDSEASTGLTDAPAEEQGAVVQ